MLVILNPQSTESVFVGKFGWEEDWQTDSQVIELIDITHLNMGFIHLLVPSIQHSGLSSNKFVMRLRGKQLNKMSKLQ